MKLLGPPCRNTEICPPWKSCLECEWRVCVSSTDALVIINFYYLRQIIVGGGYRWFAAQRYYVHKTSFRENRKDTKVVCPVMWTYDICAFDTGTYCDYY